MRQYIIGLDIGGTKISGIVYDGKKIIKQRTLLTPKNTADFKKELAKFVELLSGNGKIKILGIGVPGRVDEKKYRTTGGPNLKFVKGLNFQKLFKGYNLKIDNDANCFTRAELLKGRTKGLKNFLGIILGTGIGSGMVIDGKLFRGRRHFGGEIGQMQIKGGKFEELYKREKNRSNRNFQKIAEILADGFAKLYDLYNFDGLVIGGGFGTGEFRHFRIPLFTNLRAKLNGKGVENNIKPSKLKHAGAIGAALLFAKNSHKNSR